ncbi:MAG: thioredoxin [Bacillus thermozeamaize]|uniref:Thioredoxin n=1 Tax=Bacillus thermozeamaize TaxID=230954 RepID=A0A1Y3PAQ3_9BACI|nr:MAG: thioredoxin [Bacillus thermozeamaize]
MFMKELTTQTFDDAIREGKVLVDFWAPWCGPCRMQLPILEELSNELQEVTIAKVNVDEEATLASRFGVMSIPTLILFENGEEKERFVGVQSKEKLAKVLA